MSENKKSTATKKKFQLPHVYALLVAIIVICTILTWIVPAGVYDRAVNEATGRTVVVPGTYHSVEQTPVNPFDMVKCIYNGVCDAHDIIIFIMLTAAAIDLIISSGIFNGMVSSLLKVFKGKSRALMIPVFIAVLGVASSTIGVFEEALPFIPIFVGIAMAMGYDAIVGVAIVALGVGIGYSGAAMNPFTVGTAQAIAELAPLSGSGFRIFCHVVMIIVASVYTMRYAIKIQADPTKSILYGTELIGDIKADENIENYEFGIRQKLVLLTTVIGLVVVVWGTKTYGWYFGEICACFMIIGIISGVIMGWSVNEIAEKVAHSFSIMATSAMMVGIARAILMVLNAGQISDTIVYTLANPLAAMPNWIAAELMLIVQTMLNFLIPSGSGQAAVSMPIMIPLGDIIGISRQITVLAYQFGDGLSNIIWPTAFAPVICALGGIKLEKWWKWLAPLFVLLIITQMVLIGVALMVGFA